MIVYEKNNKLNINFENELDNPDIEIGKDEIKLGDSEITANSVLPIPGDGDTGKVPTVQEDGSYALANAGGGGSEPFVVTFSGTTAGGDAACDKTFTEISVAYAAGKDIVLKYRSIGGLSQAVSIYDLRKTLTFTNNALITVGGNAMDYVDNRVGGVLCMINERGVIVEEY